MLTRHLRKLAVSLLMALPAAANAAPTQALGRGPSVDATIARCFETRREHHLLSPRYALNRDFLATGELPVVIRPAGLLQAGQVSPAGEVNEATLALWARQGLRYVEKTSTGLYLGRLTEGALPLLAREPSIAEIKNGLAPRPMLPLAQSQSETHIESARRGLLMAGGHYLGGAGTTIVDIDSGMDVFHPAFFRADGGASPWLDDGGDGAFQPDVDGIDLDGDGALDRTEVLRTLFAGISPQTDYRARGFEPSTDWLFLDSNGDGKWNVGQGFAEDTPAFGEPIFIVDDLNGNKKLDLSERLLRLKTSKVKAVYDSRKYVRGTSRGILAYGLALHEDANALEASSHGTGVAGILVGGVPGRSLLMGLAPDADVAMGVTTMDELLLLNWAKDLNPAAILTEYAPYTGYPLDGSSDAEQLLDTTLKSGVVPVSPAGNLATSFKHRTLTLPVGVTEIPFDAPADNPLLRFTLLHRNKADFGKLSMQIRFADGTTSPLTTSAPNSTTRLADGSTLDMVQQLTSRGTAFMDVTLTGGVTFGNWSNLPDGSQTLVLQWAGSDPLELDAYLSDAVSSWGGGAVFKTGTDERTLCHPSTADHTLAIAAYNMHEERVFDGWGAYGTLAPYSSRGPRIGGGEGIALAACANPYTTGTTGPSAPAEYQAFGGTSGAGPHVAAAVALLRQTHPEMTPSEIQDLLKNTARTDGFVDNETSWGKGKLDGAKLFGVPVLASSQPLVVTVAPESTPIVGTATTFRVQAPGAVRYRWDSDYDGYWDGATEADPGGIWTADSTITLAATDEPTPFALRVEAIDAKGNVGGIAYVGQTTIYVPPADGLYVAGGGCKVHVSSSASEFPGGAAYAVAGFMGVLLARRRHRA